ncbi:MAG: RHS repeat-associated core domain-containing protein, partial [Bryobacteraceae bacterium]
GVWGYNYWQTPGQTIGTDRLGSVTYREYTGAAYYQPYGEEETATGNDTQKFATYTRDSATGLDYAQNRYYASQIGRFTTADPYRASGGPADPGSWSRYAYVQNDPVNYNDPGGLFMYFTGEGWYTVGGGAESPPEAVACDWFKVMPDTYVTIKDLSKGVLFDEWGNLTQRCQNGLTTAMPGSTIPAMVTALNRAVAATGTLVAAAGTGIDWTLLAAIGLEESGFRNVNEIDGAGVGVGVFQITVSATSGVTAAQAGNLAWAANWAANYLSNNMRSLENSFPDLDPSTILQATIDSYNRGLAGETRDLNSGLPPDTNTTPGNYGTNVLDLQDCFQ